MKIFILALGLIVSSALSAYESSPLADQYALVGVIGNGDSDSIVMLKNKNTDRKVFIKVGDSLPDYPSYRVVEAARKHVTVSDGAEEITLRPESFSDAEFNRSRISRFDSRKRRQLRRRDPMFDDVRVKRRGSNEERLREFRRKREEFKKRYRKKR